MRERFALYFDHLTQGQSKIIGWIFRNETTII